MAILMTCRCGMRWYVRDEQAGQPAVCPVCGQPAPAPTMGQDDLELQPPAALPGASAPADPSPLAIPQVPPPPRVPASGMPVRPGLRTPGMPVRPRLGARGGFEVSPAAPAPALAPTPAYSFSTPALARQPAAEWRNRYLFLGLALLPFLLMLRGGRQDPEGDFLQRLEKTYDRQYEAGTAEEKRAIEKVAERISERQDVTVEELLAVLPGDKLDGAFLPRETWKHWFLALFSAGGFFLAVLLIFPLGTAKPRHLLSAGLFTGTLGILFLLAVQYLAMFTQGFWVRGGGIITLVFYIVKFIGFSYRSALDPSNGFILSCVGFTCGVGLCEELCKALPLLWHYRRPFWRLDWRGACLWGLASGVGFGVSEGITYSADFYNGVSTGDIYLVRFVSCVGLHAIWAAAVGVAMCRNQQELQGQRDAWELGLALLKIIAVPMVLHGLYDTLLKQNLDVWAFVTAVASFGWLAFQIERTRLAEREGTDAEAPGRVQMG